MSKYVFQLRRGWKYDEDPDTKLPRDDWAEYEAQERHEKPLAGELVIEYDNGIPRLKIGDGIHEFSELPYMSVDSFVLPKQPTTINLYGGVAWTSLSANRHEQDITDQLSGLITANSKIDLHPNPTQLGTLHAEELTFTTINEDGRVRVYAVGPKPRSDYRNIPITITEVIPGNYSNEHDHVYDEIVTFPTCTEGGYTTYICSICEYTYIDNETEALGHIEAIDEAVAPTCTTTGLTEGKHCYRCNEILVPQREIPALGHTWGEWIIDKEVTDDEDGVRHHVCDVCGEIEEIVIPSGEHIHKYSTIVKAPTCLDKGYTTYTCLCGETYNDNYVDATGHYWNSTPIVVPPMCFEQGYTYYTCRDCDAKFKTYYVDPVGSHNWGEWEISINPTCEETGTELRTCLICSEVEDRDIDALGHTVVVDEAVAPSCTESGLTEGSHCGTCNKVFVSQEVIPAKGHRYSNIVITAPTCTEAGYITITCGDCDKVFVSGKDAEADQYLKDNPVLDPTPRGHTEVVDAAVAPTCTSVGYTEGSHCSVCNKVLVIPKMVDSLGHTEVIDAAVAPTCTEAGLTEGKHCSVCGEVLVPQREISALGHTWGEWVIEEEATFSKAGTKWRKCEVCHAIETQDISVINRESDDVFTYRHLTDETCSIEAINPQTISGDILIPASYKDVVIAEVAIEAFINAENINSVTFETGSQCTAIGGNAFINCKNLSRIVIPDSVTSIGGAAFENCSSLTSVVIPDSVTSIGRSAFWNCSSLESVDISNSVTSLDYMLFYNCTSLTSVTIPDSVTSIGEQTFLNCSGLTSVVIPDSVTSIGFQAFSSCSGLVSVDIPDSVTTIGNSAFSGCSSLTSVVIPDSVTSIGERTFSNCTKLTDVVIPDSVTSISYRAFYGCSSLTSVVIPDSVTTINREAFKGCSSLESVVIPDSVTYIGDKVFFECKSLASVIIPDSVTFIGIGAIDTANMNYKSKYKHSVVYCEAEAQPSGWSSSWNTGYPNDRQVYIKWGYPSVGYAITYNLSSCGTGSRPAYVKWDEEALVTIYYSGSGAGVLPDDTDSSYFEVSNCDYRWDRSTGRLYLFHPTGDVNVTINAF